MTVSKQDLSGVINWTREYFDNANISTAVVGLSGGIDSSVIASICCKALGNSNVIGVILPCESGKADRELAMALAISLGIFTGNDIDNVFEMDLAKTFQTFMATYNRAVDGGCLPDVYDRLVAANVKSRLRMTTLYAVSNNIKGLVVGTTNKSEAKLAYYTRGGDGCVDIEPLQDFLKYEVYELANLLGDIPEPILSRAPSAGLWDGQTDEDELGILYNEVDNYLEDKDIDPDKKDKIEGIIKRNKFKGEPIPYYNRGEK